MLTALVAIWAHLPPVVHHACAGGMAGAVTGALGAARSDYLAFKAMTTPKDFYTYDWEVARFRWLHGAIVGFVSGLGAGPVVGSLLG